MKKQSYTEELNFFGNSNPEALIKKYGSPLYVYNENILRQRCREIKAISNHPNFKANYSVKANSNLSLLKIIRQEGFHADAMSIGEMFVEEMAGFRPEEILFISNNASAEELLYAIKKGILVSLDSLSQLKLYGQLNFGGKVCLRFNPMVGAGHSDKVVTGGKNTKFGIDPSALSEVKALLEEYQLQLIGINQHIGSLFMEPEAYLEGMNSAFALARQFDNLEFIDFGGGFGIPYHKQDNQPRLDITALGKKIKALIEEFAEDYPQMHFKIEPGRYLVAESGVLLGQVHAIKSNFGKHYLGTDLGFNVLQRPILYNSHHDIEIYRSGCYLDLNNCSQSLNYQVVGNICESGDILATDRLLPECQEGDIVIVLDSGAYGYCMASNYNNRLRPAEVLINSSGEDILIRRAERLEDLVQLF